MMMQIMVARQAGLSLPPAHSACVGPLKLLARLTGRTVTLVLK